MPGGGSLRETPAAAARLEERMTAAVTLTKIVMPVDTLRTRRFRKLYFSGIAIFTLFGTAAGAGSQGLSPRQSRSLHPPTVQVARTPAAVQKRTESLQSPW